MTSLDLLYLLLINGYVTTSTAVVVILDLCGHH